MPTLVSDVDGAYRGIDRMPHRAEGFRYYSDLSLWDTFRTEHPWLTAVYPEYQRDFVRSLLAMSEVAGYFPRWPLGTGETGGMLGDCGALMVADTVLLPCGPSAADAWALTTSVELVNEARALRPELEAFITITRKQVNTALSKGAREVLMQTGIPVLGTELGYRVAFAESIGAGLGVTTYAPRDAAAAEVRALVDELLTRKNRHAQEAPARKPPKAPRGR